jgi:hypothetical protein
MKNTFLTLMLTAAIFTTSTYSQSANALVGVIFKNKMVKTIGSIGAIGGGGLAGVSYAVALTTSSFGTAFTGALFTALGVVAGGVGLILLDDNEIADIEFRKINIANEEEYAGFDIKEVLIYNSEVDLLNSVRQTILSEITDSDDTTEAELLWEEYSSSLSPETYEIAQAKAKVFVDNL